MARDVLLTPNLGDEQTWQDFSDIVDEVFQYNIDNPQKLLLTLRDTYSYTEPTFSVQDESLYIEEIPQVESGLNYRLERINLLDSNYIRHLVKTNNTLPNHSNNDSNLFVSTIVTLGNGVDQYKPTSEFTFKVSFTPKA